MADATMEPGTTSERDARRTKSEQRTAELSAAKAALTKAENDLKACDDSIDTHQGALVTHKRALESSKDERKGLVAARKHARSQLTAATALAAKAEAKYDKAVLAQLVHDAKDAEHTVAAETTPPAKRPYTRRSPAAKSTATKSTAAKASASTPTKTTATSRTRRVSTPSSTRNGANAS